MKNEVGEIDTLPAAVQRSDYMNTRYAYTASRAEQHIKNDTIGPVTTVYVLEI